MTPLRKQFIQKLQLQGLSLRTVQTYVSTIAELSLLYKKSPDLLSAQEIGEVLKTQNLTEKLVEVVQSYS